MKRNLSSFGWMLSVIAICVLLVGCSVEDPPHRLFKHIIAYYPNQDVTAEVIALLDLNDAGLYTGCLSDLGVTVPDLLLCHDYYLVKSVEDLYAMSKDSCQSRSVVKEIDSIKALVKQMKTKDYPDLGLTEEMLTTCFLDGELFTIRDTLRSIQARAFKEDVSDGIKFIYEWEKKASWGFAELGISPDSLEALVVNFKLAPAYAAIKKARMAGEKVDSLGLRQQTEICKSIFCKFQGLEYWHFSYTFRELAGMRPAEATVWIAKMKLIEDFLEREHLKLVEKVNEFHAFEWVGIIRTPTPRHWRGDDPIAVFRRLQSGSGWSMDHFLPPEEFKMWERKWS